MKELRKGRFWEWTDERGNQWQTIVEQYERGWWVREGYRSPLSWDRTWTHFPVSQEAMFPTLQEAQEFALRTIENRRVKP